MTNATVRHETRVVDCTFAAFVFAIVGWVLIQIWTVTVGISLAVQALAAILGFYLTAIAFWRYRLLWPVSGTKQPPEQLPSNRAFTLVHAGWSVLLLAIGILLAQVALAGWVTPLAILTIGLTFVPWSRVPLCRKHFLAAATIIGASTVCPLLIGATSAGPFVFVLAGWVFWISACFALLRRRKASQPVDGAKLTDAAHISNTTTTTTDLARE